MSLLADTPPTSTNDSPSHLAHELKEKLEGRRGFGRPMLSSLVSTWEVDPQAFRCSSPTLVKHVKIGSELIRDSGLLNLDTFESVNPALHLFMRKVLGSRWYQAQQNQGRWTG